MYKKVGKSHRQSLRRDAAFANDLRALRGYGHKRLRKGASVVLTKDLILGSEDALIRNLPRLSRKDGSGTYKLFVAPWRNATELIRVLFLQRELETLGACHAFTLNLSHAVIQSATKSPKGFVDYIRRRIAFHMKKATNERPEFWFAIEKTHKGQPHLHGAICVCPDQIESVKAALRAAGGKWEKGRGYQLRMVSVFLGDGVVDYAMKARNPGHPKHSTLVPVGRFAVTQRLCAAARKTYESERRLVQYLRRKQTSCQDHNVLDQPAMA